MKIAYHNFIVEACQEPSFEEEQVLALDLENLTVVLCQALNSLINKDLIGYHSWNSQQPADLAHFWLELALHEEFEEQAKGEIDQERGRWVKDLLNEDFA